MLAQSPAWMMPTLMGHGSSPNGRGGAALRTVSSSVRAWCRSSNAEIALWPVARIDPCVARPTTSIRNVNEPALAATTWPSVGSAMTQASPTCPRRRVAYVPRPPSSSPITVCTANGRASSMSLTARAAAMIATTPPFMSQTPRPYQVSSSSRTSHGSALVHVSGSPGGTTSTWPLRISAGVPGPETPTQPSASSRSTSSPG